MQHPICVPRQGGPGYLKSVNPIGLDRDEREYRHMHEVRDIQAHKDGHPAQGKDEKGKVSNIDIPRPRCVKCKHYKKGCTEESDHEYEPS